MKKMLSLAAMFAVLAYASPASAELKIGGDASMRVRGQFEDSETGPTTTNADTIEYAYRLRLKASADLGDGYFVKSLITTDNNASGWNTVADNNEEASGLDISQLYFGRMMQDSHYMAGRLPLNSINNPVFDVTLYPFDPTDIPVATLNMDRVYGLNYGSKLGSGEANATLVVFDNDAQGKQADSNDGMFNDGYALHLSYKNQIGDVTVEPQAIIGLTNLDSSNYSNVTANTFGLNLSMPAGDAKISMSAFYTSCDDNGNVTIIDPVTKALSDGAKTDVDYSSYLLRLKGELGNAMAWIDYSQAEDKIANKDYDNLFVWAQYNFKVHESAAGSFSLTPTLRYKARTTDNAGIDTDYSRLRTELVATVTF